MKLKYGKYKGLWICDLIGDTAEKYSYFKWLLNNPKTPKKIKIQMLEMDKPSNWAILDKFKKLPDSSKKFWANDNRNFIDFVEHNKSKL